MVNRVLFWIDIGLTQFCLAKLLQEHIDCSMYAIYAFPSTFKKSFDDQTLVSFKKTWYYWDHIKKSESNPDVSYLSIFEQKYGIDLWKLVYSERTFQDFNKYYKFSSNEILSILEQEAKFFENILDQVNPDFLIIKSTDFQRNHLLYLMCKKKKINILMLAIPKIGYRALITPSINKMGPVQTEENPIKSESEISGYLEKYNRYKQITNENISFQSVSWLKKIRLALKWLIQTHNDEFKNMYTHYGQTRRKVLYLELLNILKLRYREQFLYKNSITKIPDSDKFVFFPLQVQPESNIDLSAPFYTNQIEVISNIAKSLPVDYSLYVKEHFNMNRRNWRKISDYKQILNLPNVKLVHPSVSPDEIFKKCSLVTTISGTAGMEALFYGKPAVVFSDVIYGELPSIFKVTRLEELPELIIKAINSEPKKSDLVDFLNKLHNHSFNFAVSGFHKKFMNRFHNNGFILNNEISMNDLQKFISENKTELELLSSEYVKRIKFYLHKDKYLKSN